MSRNTSSHSIWTRLVVGLIAFILLFSVVFVLLQQSRSPVDSPTTSSSQSSGTDESNTSTTQGSESESVSQTINEPTPPSATGTSMADARPMVLAEPEALVLPELYEIGGFNLLHVLADGRLILQNAQRISLLDPIVMSETVVATADFGLQGAANDRFIVYGIGGDEVFQVEVYTIASGRKSMILDDETGYFGFELDEDNHFYTTKVEALKYGKAIGPRLDYDLLSGKLETLDDSPRSLGLHDLHDLVPSANLTWSYEVGAAWYEAWRVDRDTTFAMELSYVDIYQEQYSYQLFRLDPDAAEPLTPEQEPMIGNRPVVSRGNSLFVYDETLFYDTNSDLWYSLEDRLKEDAFTVLAMTPDQNALYLTKLDANDQPEGLWLAKISEAD